MLLNTPLNLLITLPSPLHGGQLGFVHDGSYCALCLSLLAGQLVLHAFLSLRGASAQEIRARAAAHLCRRLGP